jgi:hypothetical protein
MSDFGLKREQKALRSSGLRAEELFVQEVKRRAGRRKSYLLGQRTTGRGQWIDRTGGRRLKNSEDKIGGHQRTREQEAVRIRDSREQRTWIPKDEDKSPKVQKTRDYRTKV